MFEKIKQKACQAVAAFKKTPAWQKLRTWPGFEVAKGQGSPPARETQEPGL
jgi:hypothetical protein